MGRQYQGMDRPGIWQVPEGSGEQGKMEKTGCQIICGAPVTLTVKGLMRRRRIDGEENLLNSHLNDARVGTSGTGASVCKEFLIGMA